MNSTLKALALVFLTLFFASCSSLSTGTAQKSTKTVDFEGLQQKAQLITSRTADLKKYKVHEVSF